VGIRLELLPGESEVPEKPWLAVSDVTQPEIASVNAADRFYSLRANPVLGLQDATIRGGEQKTPWFSLHGRRADFDTIFKDIGRAPPRLRITLTLANGEELIVLPAVEEFGAPGGAP
jgi:hypothetical protein